MKKILVGSMSAFLVFALAGCGGAENTDKNNEINEKPISETESKEAKQVVETPKKIEEDTSKIKDEGKEKTRKSSIYVESLKDDIYNLSEGQSELTQESYNFLTSKQNLFPAKNEVDTDEVKNVAENVDVKILNKNSKPYYSSILQYEGYVVQIHEETYDDEIATIVNVGDGNGNNYFVFIYKSTDDIFEEDYVRFWGAPVGTFSYDTLDGGSQIANIFMGSEIEKVQ